MIAVHEAAHDPTQVPPSCSGSPSAAERVDPAGFVLLFAPGLAALLGLALLQARRRRAEAGLALSPSFPVSPPMALSWRVGVAVTTAGVFVLVISIPVPLLGPGTAHAVSPASVTYYHGDHLGSSVVVTGDVPFPGLLRRVLYSPYGGVVAETAGGSSQPPEVGFTGQRFEEAAGIYHYGARWYDPNLGRFLQPDSLVPEPFNPQSLNRYSYVMNDPVNHTDPTGNQFYFLGGSAHGGTIYSTDYGYDVYVGAGTNYSSSRGSVSYRQDRSSAPMPSRITAEPFTFAQTISMQPGRPASQSQADGPRARGPFFNSLLEDRLLAQRAEQVAELERAKELRDVADDMIRRPEFYAAPDAVRDLQREDFMDELKRLVRREIGDSLSTSPDLQIDATDRVRIRGLALRSEAQRAFDAAQSRIDRLDARIEHLRSLRGRRLYRRRRPEDARYE